MINQLNNETRERQLIIFGAGGHAKSIANIAISAGYNIKYFVDERSQKSKLFGIDVIKDINCIESPENYSFAIAVGDNSARELIYLDIFKKLRNIAFPPLIHPTATISHFCTISEGTVVMPQAVVGPNSTVGKFCILNTRSSIDHDCKMHDFSSLAPGATTGGHVTIGHRSAVSIGAIVRHNIEVGDDCVIGANSFLNKSIPNNTLAYGTPAKAIRNHQKGMPYL